MSSLKQRVASSFAVAALTLAGLAMTAAPANAASGTITGSVTCFYGNNNVSGVWVDVTSGKDGWAKLKGTGDYKTYSYKLSEPSWYQLHVGCGGDPNNWGGSFLAPLIGGQDFDWICSVFNSQKRCALS